MNSTGNLNASPSINLSPELEAHIKSEEIRLKNDAIPHIIEFGGYYTNNEGDVSDMTKTHIVPQKYGFIKFQKGNPADGINGVFMAEDVLPALINHLKALNGILPSRETALAITKLEEAKMWLMERKNNREAQGVLGTYRPHA